MPRQSSYVLSGGKDFPRRKHVMESVRPTEGPFPGENAGPGPFIQRKGCSAGQTKKLSGELKRIVFRTFALTYQTMVYGISV